MIKLLACCLALALCAPGSGTQPADALTAGAASVNITPDVQTKNLWTAKPYGGVLDSIYARVLVLSDGQNEVAIITWDLITATEQIVSTVRSATRRATGIPEGNILINASHCHSAPMSPPWPPGPWGPPDAHYLAWAEKLPDLCVSAVVKAKADMREATLSVGRANGGDWLFNRRPISPADTVVTMIEPEDPYSLPAGLRFGPVDPTLTVLALTGASGDAIATAFSLPCHATSIYKQSEKLFPRRAGSAEKGNGIKRTDKLSSGWPGLTAEHIAAQLGGQALFLQGCTGNIVPARRGLEARAEM